MLRSAATCAENHVLLQYRLVKIKRKTAVFAMRHLSDYAGGLHMLIFMDMFGLY